MSDLEQDAAGWRPLRIARLVVAAIALTSFFVVLGFPYDHLADRLIRSVERESGVRIHVAEVSPGWVRWGIGLAAQDIRVERPGGTRVELSRLAARPALSLSWLSGAPALAMEAEAPLANVSGVVTLGAEQGFAGRLRDVDLTQLPLEEVGPTHLEGRADAELDVRLSPDGPVGTVQFRAHEGSVTLAELPIALYFEKLEGDVLLGGEQWAEVRELELQSPLASGSARGTIGKARNLGAAPLRFEVDLATGDVIQASLRAQGVKVGRDGHARFTVTGTVDNPLIR